jgi:hypothetical protein
VEIETGRRQLPVVILAKIHRQQFVIMNNIDQIAENNRTKIPDSFGPNLR